MTKAVAIITTIAINGGLKSTGNLDGGGEDSSSEEEGGVCEAEADAEAVEGFGEGDSGHWCGAGAGGRGWWRMAEGGVDVSEGFNGIGKMGKVVD